MHLGETSSTRDRDDRTAGVVASKQDFSCAQRHGSLGHASQTVPGQKLFTAANFFFVQPYCNVGHMLHELCHVKLFSSTMSEDPWVLRHPCMPPKADLRTEDGRSSDLLPLVPASHVDHGLSEPQLTFLRVRFADRRAFFIESIELPEALGTVLCGLHGPLMGDAPIGESEVVYERRGERQYDSRMCDRAPRVTRIVTIIAGPHDGEPCVLYTAFGGPLTPKEPNDPTLADKDREHAIKVWSQHALSRGAQ